MTSITRLLLYVFAGSFLLSAGKFSGCARAARSFDAPSPRAYRPSVSGAAHAVPTVVETTARWGDDSARGADEVASLVDDLKLQDDSLKAIEEAGRFMTRAQYEEVLEARAVKVQTDVRNRMNAGLGGLERAQKDEAMDVALRILKELGDVSVQSTEDNSIVVTLAVRGEDGAVYSAEVRVETVAVTSGAAATVYQIRTDISKESYRSPCEDGPKKKPDPTDRRGLTIACEDAQ